MKKNKILSAFAACALFFTAPNLSAQVAVEWDAFSKNFPAKADMVSLEGWSLVGAKGKEEYIPTIRVVYYEIDDSYVYEYTLCPQSGRYTAATASQAKYDFEGMKTIFLQKIPLSTFKSSYWEENIAVEYEENDNWKKWEKDNPTGLALSSKYQKPYYQIGYQLKPERSYEVVRYEQDNPEEEVTDKSGSENSIYRFKFADEATAKAFAAKLKTKLEYRFVYNFDKLYKHSAAFTKEEANNFAALFTSLSTWRTLDKVDKITFTFADGETVTATYTIDASKGMTEAPLTLSDIEHSTNGEDYALTLSLYNLKITVGNPIRLDFWNIIGDDKSPALQLEFKQ